MYLPVTSSMLQIATKAEQSLEHHWKKEVAAADVYRPLEFKKRVSPQHGGQLFNILTIDRNHEKRPSVSLSLNELPG